MTKSTFGHRLHYTLALALAVALFQPGAGNRAWCATSFADSIGRVQPKIVKIYGAGGLRGLEAYQTGILVSPDGHVLTVWSYVLDTDYLTVTLDDGRKFDAEVVGADPQLEIAVLKLPAENLPYFDLGATVAGRMGNRVLAFSNLYGVATGNEPASVQRGVISALSKLTARRGVFKTPYNGPIYVTDAMSNNPGAAGGALTNLRGELLGMLGKELRNSQDNTWLNYAVPIDSLRQAVEDIKAGKSRPRTGGDDLVAENPVDLARLGLILVPDVVDNTPPFVDSVRAGTPAAAAGVQGDDLIIFVNNALVQSLGDVEAECRHIERGDPLRITVRRGEEMKVIQLGGITKPEDDR